MLVQRTDQVTFDHSAIKQRASKNATGKAVIYKMIAKKFRFYDRKREKTWFELKHR
jgi:hypothetical protein